MSSVRLLLGVVDFVIIGIGGGDMVDTGGGEGCGAGDGRA